jgi:hypothetical protein
VLCKKHQHGLHHHCCTFACQQWPQIDKTSQLPQPAVVPVPYIFSANQGSINCIFHLRNCITSRIQQEHEGSSKPSAVAPLPAHPSQFMQEQTTQPKLRTQSPFFWGPSYWGPSPAGLYCLIYESTLFQAGGWHENVQSPLVNCAEWKGVSARSTSVQG